MASEAARETFLAASREVDEFYASFRQQVRDLVAAGSGSQVDDLSGACRAEGKLILAYLIEQEAHACTSESLLDRAKGEPAKRRPRTTRARDT